MNTLRSLLAGLVTLSFSNICQADCLENGKHAFKVVLDVIYDEMGRPEMTEEIAEKMDREIFLRPIDQVPGFARDANTSWSDFEDSIIGGVSCFVGEEMAALRFRWRPDSDLEMLDLDEVLEAQ